MLDELPYMKSTSSKTIFVYYVSVSVITCFAIVMLIRIVIIVLQQDLA